MGLGALFVAGLLATGTAGFGRAEAAGGANPWQVCASLIEAAEQALELPPHLLQTIAKVESGRWNASEEARIAWPWTISAKGKGRYLPSKKAMLKEIRRLQAAGVKSIDVGCMQVNLKYHGEAFDSLEQAVDPVHNVAYAAVFLSQLRAETRSWTKAVGQYHSQTPKLGGKYRRKVMDAWRIEKRQAAKRAVAHRRRQVAALPAGAAGALGTAAKASALASGNSMVGRAEDGPSIPPPPAPIKKVAAPASSAAALAGIAYTGFFGLSR